MKCHIFKGIGELLESPSGVFSLLVLIVIGFVSWKQPTIGGVALAAFASVVPTILAFTENREEMCRMQQGYPSPVPPVAPAPPITNVVNVSNPAPPTDPTSV
jgi:hypothetical protein